MRDFTDILINAIGILVASVLSYFGLRQKMRKDEGAHNESHGVISANLAAHEKRIDKLDDALDSKIDALRISIERKFEHLENIIIKEKR